MSRKWIAPAAPWMLTLEEEMRVIANATR